MSISGAYNWHIEATPNGNYTLTAHGFLAEVFTTKAEAEDRIAHTTKRDEVERRTRRWSEIVLHSGGDAWSVEFDLPREEVLEDIKAALTSVLIDLGQSDT